MKQYLIKLKRILHSNLFLFGLLCFTLVNTFYHIISLPKGTYTKNIVSIDGRISEVVKREKNYQLMVKGKQNIIIYTNQQKSFAIGDHIRATGKIEFPKGNIIPRLFNYQNYLKSKKVYGIMSTNNIKIISHSKHILLKLKNKIYKITSKRHYAAYYQTFLFGNQNGFNNHYKQQIRNLGISHLYALSGMHLAVFSLLLSKLFSYLKIKRSSWIIMIILSMYVLLTSLSPSIIRAYFFFLLSFLNKEYHLKFTSLQLFFYILIIFLLQNPLIIYHIGFLYSFTISFFLLNFKSFFTGKTKILKLSLIAFLSSLPITLASSFEVNLFSVIINLFMSPLISTILFPLCLMSFLFPIVEPWLGILIFLLEHLITFLYNKCSFLLVFPSVPLTYYLLYYLFVFLTLEGLKRKQIIYLFFLCFLFFFHYFLPMFRFSMELTFLDVGQGDSTLITTPQQKKVIMIDTGGKIGSNMGIQELLPTLKSKGIKKIDYLILTHGDYDHMGEAITLVNYFKVEKVIFNCGSFNDLEKELIHVLNKKNIKYYSCVNKLNIDKYKLQFLNTKVYDNENDNSNVIYFNYKTFKFLFMGDAGVEKEKDILNKYNLPNIDFLKVGHHGSNTSSSKEFIDSIHPKYSFISVGASNRYGHPKESVLDILKTSKIYRTDLDGSIEIKLNKKHYKIRTCPS